MARGRLQARVIHSIPRSMTRTTLKIKGVSRPVEYNIPLHISLTKDDRIDFELYGREDNVSNLYEHLNKHPVMDHNWYKSARITRNDVHLITLAGGKMRLLDYVIGQRWMDEANDS